MLVLPGSSDRNEKLFPFSIVSEPAVIFSGIWAAFFSFLTTAIRTARTRPNYAGSEAYYMPTLLVPLEWRRTPLCLLCLFVVAAGLSILGWLILHSGCG